MSTSTQRALISIRYPTGGRIGDGPGQVDSSAIYTSIVDLQHTVGTITNENPWTLKGQDDHCSGRQHVMILAPDPRGFSHHPQDHIDHSMAGCVAVKEFGGFQVTLFSGYDNVINAPPKLENSLYQQKLKLTTVFSLAANTDEFKLSNVYEWMRRTVTRGAFPYRCQYRGEMVTATACPYDRWPE
jgi:hypothetical protein